MASRKKECKTEDAMEIQEKIVNNLLLLALVFKHAWRPIKFVSFNQNPCSFYPFEDPTKYTFLKSYDTFDDALLDFINSDAT